MKNYQETPKENSDALYLREENRLISVSLLEGTPPERQWTIDEYLPRGSVTGMFGPGGVGKSLLAQMAGTAVACGIEWLGINTKQGPAIGYFCEDDKNELWRRQLSILGAHGLTKEDASEFYIQSRIGMENLLMKFSGGVGVKTDFFHQIETDIQNFKPELIILDNSAQMFGGNENDRREVTQFVNALHGLINDGDLTILLLGHPPKPSAAGMQHEYSGSTGWDACFRSRLWFGRLNKKKSHQPDDEDFIEDQVDDAGDDDERILSRKKANYSKLGGDIKLKWQNGVFENISTQRFSGGRFDRIEASARLRDAGWLFMKMLKSLNDRQQEVNHLKASPNYAPKIMTKMEAASGTSWKLLERAMFILMDEGKVFPNQKLFMRSGRWVSGLSLVQNDGAKNEGT